MAAVPAQPGEKPIEKKTLHAGKGQELEFPKGTKVKFHFITKREDEVLDDSRKWDKPMELVFGKKFKLEAWELCVATMRMNEVSSFKVKPIYSAVYPAVAKTLRDTFDKYDRKTGKPKKAGEHHHSHQHVCGMMAMQTEGGVMGYDDLNELMKEPKELEFIIELLSVDLPDEYAKESWQLDVDEKLASVTKLKSEGNQLYSNKKLQDAAEKYAEAIGRLEQLILREKPQDEEWSELRKQKVPLLLNYAQCKLSLNDYYPVIEHCSEVLEIDENNIKAHFRRAKAHVGAWNPNDAREDFKKVSELDPSLTISCTKELKLLDQLEKEKDNLDKDKFKNLF